MRSLIESAAREGPALLALTRNVRADVANAAGKGDVIVAGTQKRTRHVLDLIDPQTGAERKVEVDWRTALEIDVRLARPRPQGYVLRASETEAAHHLVQQGALVLRIGEAGTVPADAYRITRRVEAKKDDVRRNDEEGVSNVVQLATALEPLALEVRPGDFYVPMAQPLANLVAAALEPDTQSSFAANRLLALPAEADAAARLPLYRVGTVPRTAMTVVID
jgi:hypothetical protein